MGPHVRTPCGAPARTVCGLQVCATCGPHVVSPIAWDTLVLRRIPAGPAVRLCGNMDRAAPFRRYNAETFPHLQERLTAYGLHVRCGRSAQCDRGLTRGSPQSTSITTLRGQRNPCGKEKETSRWKKCIFVTARTPLPAPVERAALHLLA